MHPPHMWIHTRNTNMYKPRQRRNLWLCHSKDLHADTQKKGENNRKKGEKKVGIIRTISHLHTREREVGGRTEAGREQIVGSEAGPSYIHQNPAPITHLQLPDLTSWNMDNLSEWYYQLWTKYSYTGAYGRHDTHTKHNAGWALVALCYWDMSAQES